MYFLLAILLLPACDGGLEPHKAAEKSFIRGRVYYLNDPVDTVKDMRVVAFKNYPPKDIISEITGGTAIFTNQTIAYMVDSTDFEIEVTNAPVKYEYIVVAQNYGTMLDWRAVGVYCLSGNDSIPTPLLVERGKSYFIKINVDFNNLPPQPF